MSDLKRQFSARIKFLRKKHNYTQERLAELAEVEYKHIQRLEGKSPCDVKLSTLKKLARAFNLSLSEFLNF